MILYGDGFKHSYGHHVPSCCKQGVLFQGESLKVGMESCYGYSSGKNKTNKQTSNKTNNKKPHTHTQNKKQNHTHTGDLECSLTS